MENSSDITDLYIVANNIEISIIEECRNIACSNNLENYKITLIANKLEKFYDEKPTETYWAIHPYLIDIQLDYLDKKILSKEEYTIHASHLLAKLNREANLYVLKDFLNFLKNADEIDLSIASQNREFLFNKLKIPDDLYLREIEAFLDPNQNIIGIVEMKNALITLIELVLEYDRICISLMREGLGVLQGNIFLENTSTMDIYNEFIKTPQFKKFITRRTTSVDGYIDMEFDSEFYSNIYYLDLFISTLFEEYNEIN